MAAIRNLNTRNNITFENILYKNHSKYIQLQEYLLPPIRIQLIAPPLAKNREQIQDIPLGIWPTMVSSLSTATAY